MAPPHHHIIRSHPGGASFCFYFPICRLIWNIKYQYGQTPSTSLQPSRNKDLVIVAIICTDIAENKNIRSFSWIYPKTRVIFYLLKLICTVKWLTADIIWNTRPIIAHIRLAMFWLRPLVTHFSAAVQPLKGLPCTISSCPLTSALNRGQ